MSAPASVAAYFAARSAAIFVDAGWFLAAGGLLLLKTASRENLHCDYGRVLENLTAYVDDHSHGMHRLRTYWYDAAVGGVATHEHNKIASFPYVTVRLGRLSRARQQKGVDSLIYRDLMRLAHERAISRAYLLAGDEDLREGVVDVKEMGVQVVLLGMPVEEGQNQSARLVRECDEYQVLPSELWKPHFHHRKPAERNDDESVSVARRRGEGFARRWAQRTPQDEVEAVLDAFRVSLNAWMST